MNTYSVQYFPQGATSPYTAAVTAQEFVIDTDYIVFVDDSTPPKAVFVIPHNLDPVITRTAA